MSVIAQDTFTDTAGTLLENHVGEVGATWTRFGVNAGTAAVTAAGRIRGNHPSQYAAYHAAGTTATDDQDVAVDVVVAVPSSDPVGVLGRCDPAQDSDYSVVLEQGAYIILSRRIGGITAQLGSYEYTPTVDVPFRILLELRAAAKKVYVDSVEQISSTDNYFSGQVHVGIFVGSEQTDTTGAHLDNFEVVDPAPMPPTIYERRVPLRAAVAVTSTRSVSLSAGVAPSGTFHRAVPFAAGLWVEPGPQDPAVWNRHRRADLRRIFR